MTRPSTILAICLIFVLAGYFFLFRTTSESEAVAQNIAASGSSSNSVTSASSSIAITIDDVRAAGFKTVRQETPTDTQYLPPTLYFRVGDVHVNQVSDLLMVSQVTIANPDEPLFSYGSSTVPFVITGGRGQEAQMPDGHTVINFIKNHEYVVVMGPVAKNIEALAVMIAKKIQ